MDKRVCSSSKDDSIHAGINGIENTTSNRIKIDKPCSSFKWSKKRFGRAPDASFIVPSSGVHEINLWMREDGSRVDKILLTQSSGFTPSGEGPEESERN